MFGLNDNCSIDQDQEYLTLEDYQGRVSRWCAGCGDNGILGATQRLCRDEQLPREKTVFVSGIGCAARFPHYMNTYGFHGLHGRALPIAQGIKMRRPDLHVFVNMGDGDCCSIGTAHWIHALRANMDLVVMLHDNGIYGLTKNQASPTTPTGLKTNTTPRGTMLRALNPLTVTLGVTNASFVAQVGEWIPDLLFEVLKQAFHHKGLSFVRILQRCPHFTPELYNALLTNPDNIVLLTHEKGMQIGETTAKIYKRQEHHDPSDLNRARELAEMSDRVPMGILYRNEEIGRYNEISRSGILPTWERRAEVLESAFDRFGIQASAAE
ncbi:MAG: 2-oxoglutarate oxidoreductase [Gammaproteobacteria bacterium]|jgi:2-oxoglutarate ferredoxin oxidoreductase subunit beta|nr:MAG: 2-oxoglutarate oxidoreductase [Gammaproteobacteria bacterium]